MALHYTINPAAPDESLLQECAALLQNGKILIYPTETFYALGALVTHREAIKRIFDIKGRDRSKPLPTIIPDASSLRELTGPVDSAAMALVRRFWPGPLTLLFHASSAVSPLLTGSGRKIGCRVSSHGTVQKLLHFLKAPIISTSANFSGAASPVAIDDIPEKLRSMVDVVLDAGRTRGGLPSTVVDVSSRPFGMIRQGSIAAEMLRDFMDTGASD